MNSKYKILASNTIVFAIGNILVKLISFFLMPLYTSVLTTSQYGVAELLNNTIEIVSPLATLCIVEALYRFSIDEHADHCVLFVDSIVVILFGDIVVGIASLIWYYILDYKYAFYFFILYITSTFYRLTVHFARGRGHVKRFVTYGVLNSLLLVLSNIILLVVLKGEISAYLLSFSIGYGISGVAAFWGSNEYTYVKLSRFDKTKLKELLNYSIPSIPNMLSWWVNSLSDRYIVLYYWGSGTAGLYTAASKLPAMINLVTSIFQQAWQYSTAAEIDSKDNKDFFSTILRVYTYVCVMVCAALVIINKLICNLLLQADFYTSWKLVPLLLLAATFGCIGTYFGTFYNAIKNNKMLMFSTLIGAIGNIVLNFMLIPIYGGMGAAIATAISYFVIMSIRIIDVRRFVALNIDFKRFIFQFGVLTFSAVFGCFSGVMSVIISMICFICVLMSDCRFLKKIVYYIMNIICRIIVR